jgi:hypothetical protein
MSSSSTRVRTTALALVRRAGASGPYIDLDALAHEAGSILISRGGSSRSGSSRRRAARPRHRCLPATPPPPSPGRRGCGATSASATPALSWRASCWLASKSWSGGCAATSPTQTPVRDDRTEADAVDAQEDERFGDRRGDELPLELQTGRGRREWLRAGRRRLKQQRDADPRPIPAPRPERLKQSKRRLQEELWAEMRANGEYLAYRSRGVMSNVRRLGPSTVPKPWVASDLSTTCTMRRTAAGFPEPRLSRIWSG